MIPPLAIGAGAVVVMAMLSVAASIGGLDVEAAVSDPYESTGLRFLGIVSNVGVLVWASAVSVCLFAVTALDQRADRDRLRWFFMASAAVAAMLLIDDMLAVHEFADDVVAVFVDFDRTSEQKDILEAAVFVAYGIIFGLYAFLFRDVLRQARELRFLVASLAMFALSVFFDFDLYELVGIELPGGDDSNVDVLVEEIPKFVGIVYFATFYFHIARQSLQPAPNQIARV